MVKVTVIDPRDPTRPYSCYEVPEFHQGAGFIRRRMPDDGCILHKFNKKSKESRESFKKAAKGYHDYNEEQKKAWENVEVVSFAQPRTSKEDKFVGEYQAAFSTIQKQSFHHDKKLISPFVFDLVVWDAFQNPLPGVTLKISSQQNEQIVYEEVTNGVGVPPSSGLLKFFETYIIRVTQATTFYVVATIDPTIAQSSIQSYSWGAEEFSNILIIKTSFVP